MKTDEYAAEEESHEVEISAAREIKVRRFVSLMAGEARPID
jgi:hypothetical protein